MASSSDFHNTNRKMKKRKLSSLIYSIDLNLVNLHLYASLHMQTSKRFMALEFTDIWNKSLLLFHPSDSKVLYRSLHLSLDFFPKPFVYKYINAAVLQSQICKSYENYKLQNK